MPPLAGDRIPGALSHAVSSGILSVSPESGGDRAVTLASSIWEVPVILAAFSDETLTHDAGTFQRLLFDTTRTSATGSVFDYYQWASSGKFTVKGRVVATIRLPETSAFYASGSAGFLGGTPNNAFGAMRDALRACADTINWRPFDADGDGVVDIVWLVHAGVGSETSGNMEDLWSVTSFMGRGWRDANTWYTKTPYQGGSTGQTIRIDRFSILPELSHFVPGNPAEIGVFCHEFGHALGLPDLYSTSPETRENTGPGNWSLMGSGGYGGDGHSPEFPTHLGAWPIRFLGWDRTIHPTRDTTVSIEALEGTGTIVDFSFQGEEHADHFLIEYRRRVGFDRNLPNEGLIVYHVEETVMTDGLNGNSVNVGPRPGLRVVEADGRLDLVTGFNRGDASDPFPGASNRTSIDEETVPNTQTFRNSPSNLAIREIQAIGDRMRFTLQVQPPGWLQAVDVSGPSYAPAEGRSVSRQSAVDSRGHAHVVGTELIGGRLQVVLRSGEGMPYEGFQVSNSTAGASDPTLALLPGGSLAVVWTDSRRGRPMLFYRSRVAGVWSDERLLVEKPGSCTHPSIASSDRGTIALAFRYTESNTSQLQFMRFTYFSAFGSPVPITPMSSVPSQPSVIDARRGSTVIVWNDRSAVIPRLVFVRHHPDSGLTQVMPLTPPPSKEQSGFSAVMDSVGTLHVAWQVTGPGFGQIRYQRRSAQAAPSPTDTILETRGETVGRPVIEAGPGGVLHLSFEASRSGVSQIRYKRWRPAYGWDAYSTEVTPAGNALCERPRVFASANGDLTVAYSTFSDGAPRLMARRRALKPSTTLGVPAVRAPVAHVLSLGPNPLRAGHSLVLRWGGGLPEADGFDVFDVSGRAVARLPASPSTSGFLSVPSDVTSRWSTGVYFVRPRSIPLPPARLLVIR